MTRRRAKAPSQRQLRVGEEIRHILSQVLTRGGLRDPELAEANITVTEVRVSPDLKNATAFVTPFSGGSMETVVAALQRAAPFFQARLGEAMNTRFTPRLRFEPDRSFDEAARIEALLRRPRVQRDLETDPENGEAGAPRDNDDGEHEP